MHHFNAGLPLPLQAQRNRDYMRQRQYSLSDLLLENRIIFFGSVGASVLDSLDRLAPCLH